MSLLLDSERRYKKMKKFLVIFLVALLIAPVAFAASKAVPTVISKQCYEDASGTSYCRVIGTLAFDSTYGCDSTTSRCGASLDNTLLGLSSIKKMYIEPTFSASVGTSGGTIVWNYTSTGVAGNGLIGAIIANVAQARTSSTATSTVAPLVSAASYDFSALSAVPFEAIGPVL